MSASKRRARAASAYGTAVGTCANTGRPPGPGRRLPTHGELRAALSGRAARARRRADVGGVSERDTRRARCALRHRPGRQCRDYPQHRRRRQGVPLRRRPPQLRSRLMRPHSNRSLSAHLRVAEDHSRLPFHPSCPVCRRDRLAGSLDGEELVSRRTQAAIAAGLLAFSTGGSSAAMATPPDEIIEGTSEVVAGGDPAASVDFEPSGETVQLPDEAPDMSVAGAPVADDDEDAGPLEQEPVTDVHEQVVEADGVLTEQADEAAPAPDPAPVAPAPAPDGPDVATMPAENESQHVRGRCGAAGRGRPGAPRSCWPRCERRRAGAVS